MRLKYNYHHHIIIIIIIIIDQLAKMDHLCSLETNH